MALIIVGVADYKVSQDPKAVLITCALGLVHWAHPAPTLWHAWAD